MGRFLVGGPLDAEWLSRERCWHRLGVGTDVRPDFSWNRKPVAMMGYR